MRKCSYCAEEIPDEAVRCPFCDSDLTRDLAAVASPSGPNPSDPPGPAPAVQGPVGEGALAFSHSGTTYLLGWGATFFGIWNRNVPGGPARTFPRTDEGWRDAWLEYARMETNFVSVPPPQSHGS